MGECGLGNGECPEEECDLRACGQGPGASCRGGQFSGCQLVSGRAERGPGYRNETDWGEAFWARCAALALIPMPRGTQEKGWGTGWRGSQDGGLL